MTEELREKIVEILCPFYEDCIYRKESSCFTLGNEVGWKTCHWVGKSDQILALIKEAGYVKLAEYQSLSIPSSGISTVERNRLLEMNLVMPTILRAGFRKVEL